LAARRVRRRGGALGALLAVSLAACSGGGNGAPSPTPRLFTGAAASYLLGLDQLHIAEFTVAEVAHQLGEQALSTGDAQLDTALRAAGLQDAATVRYFRVPADLATANGFLDVRSTVLRFGGAGAAHRAFLAEVRHTDDVPHIVPESTDALGDEAHGDQLTEAAPDGVQLVEATVIIRNANLVELVVIRGRLGGTGMSDALVLGHTWLSGQG
jgi:hypothetical protein